MNKDGASSAAVSSRSRTWVVKCVGTLTVLLSICFGSLASNASAVKVEWSPINVVNDRGYPQLVDVLIDADHDQALGEDYLKNVLATGFFESEPGQLSYPPYLFGPLKSHTFSITRNAAWVEYPTGLEAFPEGIGVRYSFPSVPTGAEEIVLPSFGFPSVEPELSPPERGLLGLINDYRAADGLARLRNAPALSAAADGYSNWACQKFGKLPPEEGRSHSQRGSHRNRIRDYGVWTIGASGENIAFLGSQPAWKSFEMWKGSGGHNWNMLRPYFRYVGLGSCKDLGWVVMVAIEGPSDQSKLFGGVTDDVGDSSLATVGEEDGGGGGDKFSHKRRFSPRLRLTMPRSRRPMLIVKVNGVGASGRLEVYSGKATRSTESRTLKLRLRSKGQIRISFTAEPGSRTRSGTIARCYSRKNGRARISSCRRQG